jgi:adenylylsulfate kinase-like enzyme
MSSLTCRVEACHREDVADPAFCTHFIWAQATHDFTLMQYLTRFLFFTGKCGVGKTSISCAAAFTIAVQGMRVQLVSTDPA